MALVYPTATTIYWRTTARKPSANSTSSISRRCSLSWAIPADRAAVEAKTVLVLETALARVSKTRVERRDPEGNHHKMTVEELSKVAPDFEWRMYFTVLGAPEPGGMDVGQPEFIAAAVRLFPGYAQVWRVNVRMESIDSRSNSTRTLRGSSAATAP